MKGRLPALVLLAAVLAAPAASQDKLDEIRSGLKAVKSRQSGKPDGLPSCGSDAKPCRCEGPRGRKKFFHHILYQQNFVVGTPFTNDIAATAGIVMSAYNVELIKPPENEQGTGGHQLFEYPKQDDCDRRSETDKKKDPVCVIAIDDQIAFCQVVRDAFKAHAPPAGYFPVFLLWFGSSLKKQIGSDVAGQFYPKGAFKSSCDVVGEAEGVPDTAFAVVDVKPDTEIKQVLIHEMGHAIGDSVGHKNWFEDQYPGENAPADVKNIMVSRRGLTDWKDMKMSPLQVQALCSSPYTSDTP
jgi:hypothetical protein